MYDILTYFSLSDPLLIFGIIASPIFVDPFPLVFTVLSDVFLVLLTIIGSLAAYCVASNK